MRKTSDLVVMVIMAVLDIVLFVLASLMEAGIIDDGPPP